MSFLRRFASSVTVLHEGRILSEGSVAEVQADERVREVYLGRSRDERSGAGLGDGPEGSVTGDGDGGAAEEPTDVSPEVVA